MKTEAELRGYLNNVTGTISSLAPPVGKTGFEHLFFVRTDPNASGYPHWYKDKRGEFLFVLASTGEGRFSRELSREGVDDGPAPTGPVGMKDTGRFSLPLTADYDLFAICPPLAHMEPVFDDSDVGKAGRKMWDHRKVGQRMLERLAQIRKLNLTEDWAR